MWAFIASINLALAVATGAFGAHGLKSILDPAHLSWWQTAVSYWFYHALGMLILGLYQRGADEPSRHLSGIIGLLQWGIVGFCGSLCALALGAPRSVGMITPIGGTLWLVAWGWLTVILWQTRTISGNHSMRAESDLSNHSS